MAASNIASRPYDVVLFGATGYTGAYTIKHICKLFHADTSWAIAGRNASKLEAAAADINKEHPGRKPPAIEVCSNEAEPLKQLAQKTKVIITTVGPYAKYGEEVVKACAQNGTGYIDCTGEVPWVKHMIEKYDATAKDNGAIIVPQAGVESALSDLFVHQLVAEMRDAHGLATRDVTNLLWELKSDPSGGTFATVFALFEAFSIPYIMNAMKPYSLSPVPRVSGTYPARGGLGRFTGTKWVDKLGWAANSGPIMGVTNAAIVWRTWGLFQQTAGGGDAAGRQTRSARSADFSYGPRFHYTELRSVSNRLVGTMAHFAVNVAQAVLLFPFVRWLVKQVVFKPGQGPTAENTKDDRIEFRAVATAEGAEPKKIVGKAMWKGSMYDITGLTLAAGARSLVQLYDEKAGKVKTGQGESFARVAGGGLMTPACLGSVYTEGLREGGVVIDIQ